MRELQATPRDDVFALLDNAAAGNWGLVHRISRVVARTSNPDQRDFYADQWIKLRGSDNPEVVRWIKDRRRERRDEVVKTSCAWSGLRWIR